MATANGWTSARLEEVANTATGGTPPRKNGNYFEGVIPWVKSGELDDNIIYDTEEHLSQDAIRDSSAKVFPKGTVLVALYGATVGKTSILETDAATNQAVCAIFVNDRVLDHRYLRFFLMHIRPALLSQRYGGAQPNISQTIIRNTQVTLPPFDEQRQIATVLSTVQRAVERQERLIALTAELKKALMHKLFTEGTRDEPRKHTEIGLIPQSWTVTVLGELCKKPNGRIQTGPFGSVLHKNEYQKVGTPIVNPVHLIDNRIDHTETPRIGEDAAERLHRYRLKENDLLFGRRGDIGRHGIVTKEEAGWFCGTGCFIVRVSDPRIDAEFINAFISKNEVIGWLERHAAGVIMPNLSNRVLDRMPICFPSRQEQTAIAAALKKADDKASIHNRTARSLGKLFRTLLHQLMTAEIRAHDLDLSALEEASPPAEAATDNGAASPRR